MRPQFQVTYKQANVTSPEISGTITSPSGGVSKNWTVAAGEYASFTALATAIETAINAQYAGHGCDWNAGLGTGDDRTFQVYSNTNFDLTVNEPLQAFTGIPDGTGVVFGVTTYYVNGSAPGAFYSPTCALSDNDKVRVYYRDQTHKGTTVYTVDRAVEDHDYPARVTWRGATEKAQWRSFLSYARAGTPFRLYVNEDDATAWSDSNLDGYLDCVLPQDQATTAELMVNEPITTIGYFDMRPIVIA